MSETTERDASAALGGSRLKAVVRRPHFVCTECLIHFPGETSLIATCPKCGDKYHGNFFTKLIRDDTFALVYWYDANPGVEVKPWEAGA